MNFIEKDQLCSFLEGLSGEYRVFLPAQTGETITYRSYNGDTLDENSIIGKVRSWEPLKAFYFLGREKVADNYKPDMPNVDSKPPCIVGVKACDLKGFRILDHVFLDEEYGDPTYIRNRKEGLIISADCTESIDTCFCCAVGVEPHPSADYDINLTEVEGGYLVESGSEKGKSKIDKYSNLFSEASPDQIKGAEALRAHVKESVNLNIEENGVPADEKLSGAVEAKYDSEELWKDAAETCVECGACNTICPTCHCFLLYDQKTDSGHGRFRIWDSCMIKDFARVGGGENPRARLWMRLRNRFDKKFDYFPNVTDVIACTGCGRCISACPGKIDIREVLNRLVSE